MIYSKIKQILNLINNFSTSDPTERILRKAKALSLEKNFHKFDIFSQIVCSKLDNELEPSESVAFTELISKDYGFFEYTKSFCLKKAKELEKEERKQITNDPKRDIFKSFMTDMESFKSTIKERLKIQRSLPQMSKSRDFFHDMFFVFK